MDVSPLLIKFGKREHVEQFRAEGRLYMNSLPYFWQLDEDDQRGDPFDGLDHVSRGQNTVIHVGSDPQSMRPIRVTSYEFTTSPDDAAGINIFCMYAAYPERGRWPVHSSVLALGDSAVVVHNLTEFLRRLRLNLEVNQIVGKAQLVEYVEDQHDGELGPFRKHQRFTGQSEWRLVTYGGNGGVRSLTLGSLEDISDVLPSTGVNDLKFFQD